MFDKKMKDYQCEASSESLKLMQLEWKLEWNLFVRRIVTDNEIWHYDHVTKQQNMQWKHASSPSRKFKVQAGISWQTTDGHYFLGR